MTRSKENHLIAPLPKSVPKKGKRTNAEIEATNPTTLNRLINEILLRERNKTNPNDRKP